MLYYIILYYFEGDLQEVWKMAIFDQCLALFWKWYKIWP